MAFVKHLVSKKKRRFVEDGFDLDLTYVTDHLVAMGFPAEGTEGVYRNHMKDVQRFLKKYHDRHCKVYNLCQERFYCGERFNNTCAVYPFEDHNPPPFKMLVMFCEDACRYSSEHVDNVVVVHCKAGKGRTGTACCGLLVYNGTWDTASDALSFYAMSRTEDAKGVVIPSQKRYVYYLERFVNEWRDLGNGSRFPFNGVPVTLTMIRLTGSKAALGGCDPYFVVEDMRGEKLYNQLKDKNQPKLKSWRKNDQTHELFCQLRLCGDVCLKFFDHNTLEKDKKMFFIWIHTSFLTGNSLVFKKKELDKAFKDTKHHKYPEDFQVELIFSDVESKGGASIAQTAAESENKAPLSSTRKVPTFIAEERSLPVSALPADVEDPEDGESTGRGSVSGTNNSLFDAFNGGMGGISDGISPSPSHAGGGKHHKVGSTASASARGSGSKPNSRSASPSPTSSGMTVGASPRGSDYASARLTPTPGPLTVMVTPPADGSGSPPVVVASTPQHHHSSSSSPSSAAGVAPSSTSGSLTHHVHSASSGNASASSAMGLSNGLGGGTSSRSQTPQRGSTSSIGGAHGVFTTSGRDPHSSHHVSPSVGSLPSMGGSAISNAMAAPLSNSVPTVPSSLGLTIKAENEFDAQERERQLAERQAAIRGEDDEPPLMTRDAAPSISEASGGLIASTPSNAQGKGRTLGQVLFTDAVRRLVSKKKKRLVKDGFDLDLSYISTRIIAMGFPSDGTLEGMYRNKMSDVQKFFKHYHKDHFKVYNLCSEANYSADHFESSFAYYPFVDHEPCPFKMLVDICEDAHQFLSEDPFNVVAFHCKAGKGRTGLTVASLMYFLGKCRSPAEALALYDEARTQDAQGVTLPSHIRYVHYMEWYIREYRNAMKAFPLTGSPINITKFRMGPKAPDFDLGGGCDPYIVITQIDGTVLFSKQEQLKPNGRVRDWRREPEFVVECNVPVQGDIKIELWDHDTLNKDERMCWFWFNTSFIRKPSVVFGKNELDRAHKDKQNKEFAADFFIEVFFAGDPSKAGHTPRTLRDLLTASNSFCLDAFKRFLAKEMSSENLLFYMAVEEFRQKRVELAQDDSEDAAKALEYYTQAIMRKYIVQNDPTARNTPVNLPEPVVDRVNEWCKPPYLGPEPKESKEVVLALSPPSSPPVSGGSQLGLESPPLSPTQLGITLASPNLPTHTPHSLSHSLAVVREDSVYPRPAAAERTCFDEAQEHIFNLMNSDTFKRFLRSDLFKQYLEDYPFSA